MDINNNTAKHLAQMLEYNEIVNLIDKFLEAQPYVDLRRLYRFQIKEIKNAEKRRVKYALLMKNANKWNKSEYEKKKEEGCDQKGKKNQFTESYVNKSRSAGKIVLNENVTLLTYNSTETL